MDAANLPEPSVLAGEAMGELVQAPGELNALMRESGADEEADGARVLLREMRLTCQKTRGQGFMLRQQLHEYGEMPTSSLALTRKRVTS